MQSLFSSPILTFSVHLSCNVNITFKRLKPGCHIRVRVRAKQPIATFLYVAPLCLFGLNFLFRLLSQGCAYALVSFRHKTPLVILRKTSRIGLKYQFWRQEILLEISKVSFKTLDYVSTNAVEDDLISLEKYRVLGAANLPGKVSMFS